MKSISLEMTLQEPLVISQTNATEGAHRSLDYLPGATILGAIASTLYSKLKSESLDYEVFHSGSVRFNNAYPLVNKSRTYPVPFSLYKDKSEKFENRKNYLQGTFGEGIQGKQERNGYVFSLDSTWNVFEPERYLQMRTAIDEKRGVAKDAQLYGYQMVQKGLTYFTTIDCDNSETAERLTKLISQQNELLIGRSRSAQYGRVSVKIVPPLNQNKTKPTLKMNGQNYLVLWLASDMMIYNNQGQPDLVPSLQTLGLEAKGELDKDKSFIRTRQYAPYNGFRRSYDMERQVIQQGSVLVYKVNQDVLSDTDFQILKDGLGCYTENGLGQVVTSDAFLLLSQADINLTKCPSTPNVKQERLGQKPQTPLIQYLSAQHTLFEVQQKNTDLINDCMSQLKKLYDSARNFNGISPGTAFGPSKTQWSAIREIATNSKSKEEMRKKLFEDDKAFIRQGDEHWDVSTGEQTFMIWLKKGVEDNPLEVIRGLAYMVSEDKNLIKTMEGNG